MGISKKLGSTNLSLEVLSIHILSYASRLETWFCYQHKGFLVVKVNPLPVSQCPHELQVYLHVFSDEGSSTALMRRFTKFELLALDLCIFAQI